MTAVVAEKIADDRPHAHDHELAELEPHQPRAVEPLPRLIDDDVIDYTHEPDQEPEDEEVDVEGAGHVEGRPAK